MTSQALAKLKLPDTPGVYFFRTGRKIIYIGKATSLHDRVRSYFAADLLARRGPIISRMIEVASTLSFQQTDSVLEALILEAAEIRKHEPPYNSKEKDNKSFNYVLLTKEEFPRLLLKRGRELALKPIPQDKILHTFGPFPHGTELRAALKIIRKIFPYRDRCLPNVGQPCFNAQIGLCPGVCSGRISRAEYGQTIKELVLFFQGKKKALLRLLEQMMKKTAREEDFEQAEKIKRQIFALGHIRDVALIKERSLARGDSFRLEAYDIAHLSGQAVVGVMTVLENGELVQGEYRRFRLRGKAQSTGGDIPALQEVLQRRLAHQEWPWPSLIVVDGGRAQLRAVQKILAENGRSSLPVVSVVKDEHHRPREILGERALIRRSEREIILANAEAHRYALAYHRQTLRRMI